MTRIFLVDDHEIVRRGLREMLESQEELEVVQEAGSVAEAMGCEFDEVDVAIVDVRLPDGSGIEVCRWLQDRPKRIPCLMLTSFSDDEALLAAVVAGASGYFLKEIRSTDLISSVQRVAAGEMLLDPELVAKSQAQMKLRVADRERLERLSPQEQRILELLVDGHSNREIAEAMFLAEKTVKNYVSSVLLKLGFARRTEAAVFAAKHLPAHPQD
jgi:DNA-binding NarL/FixJ family response regulator